MNKTDTKVYRTKILRKKGRRGRKEKNRKKTNKPTATTNIQKEGGKKQKQKLTEVTAKSKAIKTAYM